MGLPPCGRELWCSSCLSFTQSHLVPCPAVRQYADICLFSTAQYKCPVAQLEQDDQVSPSSTFCKVYTITPLLSDNREKRGLALDGQLKHEDTNLASSTM